MPCSTALMFAIFVIAWSRDGISLLREQAKQSFYNDLMLVESQVNTIIRSEFDRITMVSSNLSNHIDPSGHIDPTILQNVSGRTDEVWVPSRYGTQLEALNQRPIDLNSSTHSVTSIENASQTLLRNEWNGLNSGKHLKIDPSTILNQANIAISETSGVVAFVVPIIGQDGFVKGLVCSKVRASKIQTLLPDNTVLFASTGNSVITKDGINPPDVSLNQSVQEHDPRFELFSLARRIPISKSVPAWRLRSDHTNSEMWSKPEFKRLLDFNGAILLLILSFTYIWIQSSNRVRNRQRKLIGNLTQKIIWITNEDGKIDTVLGNVTDRLGWKELDYIDVNIGLFVHPDDRVRLEEAIGNAKETATKDDLIEIRFENESHRYRWYEVTATNMIHVPEINGIVLTAHDIEHRMHATTLILASKRAAEMANEAKSEFLSRMSHELRTPLNAILGFGQLLEMDSITERQADNVDQILIAGRHLLDLVNDILDLARIENQKVSLKKDQVRVSEVIQECISLMAPLSAKSQVQIHFEAAQCPDIRSDRQKLKQVLLNLLSNGIKYNRPGGSVEVSLDQTGPGLKLLVRDTGIGIKSEYLDRVFTAFDRLGSESSGVEGTGIGLVVAKQLVE
ncbi:MAG: PAS domain-containing sensor histidine kinase, partial [Armatimonadota bacterium]